MRVISCKEPKHLQEIIEDIPTARQGEVIIKVKRIGICGTDVHAYNGNQPYFTYPRVLGHELSGEIVDVVGDDKIQVGDLVTIIPYMECGKCVACRNGKTNCCTDMKVFGVHMDGGMKEYIRVPVDHVLKVNNLSLDEASMVEPLSIGAHAVRRSNLKAGQIALVIGAGPIGLGVMRLAKLTGATVIAMDVNEDRLTFCKQWAGVDHIVHAQKNPIDRVKDFTNGEFPTVVFDATGNKSSMMSAFNFVSHGGMLVYVGLVKDDLIFNHPEFHKREMSLLASRNATLKDFLHVIDCIEEGLIQIDGLITNRTNFSMIIDDFESYINPANKVIKAVIEM
ncbi:zinc-binding alcohol dehydrogenase family protein [Peribacillus huizhouensis]|uniref:Alcohol dehydrogenase n=1 Tax=Peribacillus huizhouensis TaxID=1501239 RepID=A0ABR6CQV6_9BACI|nr:zinc-binding alcohol dehydrogenase family protein [Peribacillus huizhouensis]MBA9027415.1 hypothetical protein [Peribacillus huizhouensis]